MWGGYYLFSISYQITLSFWDHREDDDNSSTRDQAGLGCTQRPNAPLPSCPAPQTLPHPDFLLLLTPATGHSGQRQRARPTWHLLPLGKKWGTCGSRGCLSLCSLPRGPSLSEPHNHISITSLPGLTPMHAEDSPQARRAVNLRITRTVPLTPTAPNGTCQGLDPGPLKEPG